MFIQVHLSRTRPRYTTWQNEFNSCHAPQVQRFEQDWHDAGDDLEALTKLYRDRKAHVEGEIKVVTSHDTSCVTMLTTHVQRT